jgi:hypothetical protein
MGWSDHNPPGEFRPAGRAKPPVDPTTLAERRAHARGCCETCGERRSLEAHHTTYEREGREHVDDLRMLCRDCHRRAHVDLAGDFWADPEEKESHWGYFWSAAERD